MRLSMSACPRIKTSLELLRAVFGTAKARTARHIAGSGGCAPCRPNGLRVDYAKPGGTAKAQWLTNATSGSSLFDGQSTRHLADRIVFNASEVVQ